MIDTWTDLMILIASVAIVMFLLEKAIDAWVDDTGVIKKWRERRKKT